MTRERQSIDVFHKQPRARPRVLASTTKPDLPTPQAGC